MCDHYRIINIGSLSIHGLEPYRSRACTNMWYNRTDVLIYSPFLPIFLLKGPQNFLEFFR